MLKIKTKLGPSKIHGIGLFADQCIRKGAKIWEWNVFYDRIIAKLPDDKIGIAFMKKYACKVSGKYMLCCDDCRFMNHSDKPNIDCYDGYDLANKNIKRGEELTCNYNLIYDDFEGF
jgi:SET domain-containing protein